MHARATEGVGRDRRHSGQRFPFTGLHLHDVALMEREPGDQLLVERAESERTASQLTDQREQFLGDRVERGAGADTRSHLVAPASAVRYPRDGRGRQRGRA